MAGEVLNEMQEHWAAAQAIASRDHLGLAKILQEHPENILKITTLIERAVWSGDEKIVDMLVTAGLGSENYRDFLRSGLKTACEKGYEAIIRSLICAGAPMDVWLATNQVDELFREYESYRPSIDPGHHPESLKERLLKENQQRFRPLDNPKTWHRFAETGAILLEQGTPLTKEDLFACGVHGERAIEVAIASRALPAVMAHLEAQGDPLTLQDIREEGLLNIICQKGGTPLLFSEKMLVPEGGRWALEALCREVPQEALWQVNYLSQLRLSLGFTPAQGKATGR